MPDITIGGLERVLLGFRDSTGGSTGQQSTLSNGSTSGAYVMQYVRTANFAAQPAVNLDFQGGDIIYGSMMFGNSRIQPFDIIATDWDTTLVTLLSGSTVNTTNAQATIVSDNPNRAAPRSMWVGLQSRYQASDGSSSGYVTQFLPNCDVKIKRNGPGFQAGSDTVVSVTPRMATKSITAQGFGTGSNNLAMTLTGDRTDNYYYLSAYPIHVVSFRQDNSTTTVNTIYKPVSTTVTLNNTPNSFFVANVATALSAITLAGVATLAAAGTAAVLDVLIHETEYVPV